MPALRFTIGGKAAVIDTDNLMLSELEVLEEFAGVDIDELNAAASLKKVRFLGHLLWLLKLHETAEERSISLREAAGVFPRDGFDLPVGELQVEAVEAPKGPSRATPRTRSPRTGSSKPRARSAKSGSSGSALSPSTSDSLPGTSSG